jgi:trans-aconitate methyltransferase
VRTSAQSIRRTIAAVAALELAGHGGGRDDLAVYLPWMPFSWPAFISLLAEALPETYGNRFLDVGCGLGTKMMLAEELFGLDVHGIERSPELAKAAREHWLTVDEADALTWDGYGDIDIIFLNRPFSDQALEAQLEDRVWQEMKPGAVVIGVNLVNPPPSSWYLILDDSEVRRWIMQKV